MRNIFSELIKDLCFIGDIKEDSTNLLNLYGYEDVAEHSIKVANNAKKIARKFGYDEENAFIAGCLHDISNVFPNNIRLDVCRELEIEVFQEERIVLSLLHPKISKVMAAEIFDVKNEEILNAIECHSTLKANAGKLDIILFIADKISWDDIHNQNFLYNIIQGLEKSLEHGAFAYLDYMFKNKEQVKVFHPWAVDAYNEMIEKLREGRP